jgi:hypothetical protein
MVVGEVGPDPLAPAGGHRLACISLAGMAVGDRLIVNQTGNSDGSSKLFALTAGGWITLNTLGRFGVAYPFGFGF